MTGFKKSYFIKAGDFTSAGEASISVQNLLKTLNFDPKIIRRVAICGYESEMNVVMHGADGHLNIEFENDILTMVISDNGPGIEDIELAMKPGYSTAPAEIRELGFGAGMGLYNIRNCVDEMQLESTPAKGTKLVMVPGNDSKEWELSRATTPGQGTRLTMKIYLHPQKPSRKKSSS